MVGIGKYVTFPLKHDTQPSLPAAKDQPLQKMSCLAAYIGIGTSLLVFKSIQRGEVTSQEYIKAATSPNAAPTVPPILLTESRSVIEQRKYLKTFVDVLNVDLKKSHSLAQ